MAGREELIDAIAGFGLFADLSTPQLEGIVHTFEEAVFAEGERVLRQGLSGSGFYVILDGEAAVVVDGTERARLGRGDFFGEVSILLGESPIADIVATRPLRCLVLAGPRSRRSSSPIRGSCTGCSRPRRAGCAPRTDGGADTRPFPPGSYPVIVIGSGPGATPGLVLAPGASGVEHAVLSADPSPGGMFRRWPFFQRLLSWTKPHAPVERGTRGLRAVRLEQPARREPETRAIQPSLMDGTSYFPSRPEMEANLVDVRRPGRAGGPLRLPLDGDAVARGGPRRRSVRARDDATASTAAGRWSSPSGSPSRTPRPAPGWSSPHHYADVRPAETYAGSPGVHHRQAELRVRAGERAAAVGAPARPGVAVAGQAVGRHPVAGRRPGALRPAVRGPRPGRRRQRSSTRRSTGSSAAPDGIARRPPATDRRRRGPPRRGRRRDRRDRVRRARSWTCPRSGWRRSGRAGCRPRRPWWESTTLPGVFFAGTIGQGAQGPPAGTACRRTRVRSTARATTPGSWPGTSRRPGSASSPSGRAIAPDDAAGASWRPSWPRRPSCSTSAATSPGSSPSIRTAGCATTASSRWRTSSTPDGPDALAATLEADGTGAIYPVLFTPARRRQIDGARPSIPDPLLRYDGRRRTRGVSADRRDAGAA